METDELIRARTEDLITRCRDGWYVTNSGLLDTHGQSVAVSAARELSAGVRTVLYGGYDEAERRMLVCIPSELPISDEEATEGLLEIIRAERPPLSRGLSHRDYLGSVLGLGIDRSVTGDILVRDDGADIIVMPEISSFLLREYTQAGRVPVKTARAAISELIIPERKTEIIRDTVSALRLDSVTASAFRLPRSKAAEAIRGGLVSVDHLECLKPDRRLDEGTVLVLKGKGRAVLREAGGESKKNRIRIKIERYL